jgi:Transmembrane domain of unknown function (DUF3566)
MAVRSEAARTTRAPGSTPARPPAALARRLDVPATDEHQARPEPLVEYRRVRHVALRSVARVSVLFYLCGLVAFLVAAMVFWIVASAAGVVGEVESFMDDLGFEGFEFVSGTLLWAGLLIGFAVTAILVVLTVFAAAVYNLFADLAGGIEIELDDRNRRWLERVDSDGRSGNGRGRRGNGKGARRRR